MCASLAPQFDMQLHLCPLVSLCVPSWQIGVPFCGPSWQNGVPSRAKQCPICCPFVFPRVRSMSVHWTFAPPSPVGLAVGGNLEGRCSPYYIANDHEAGVKQHKVRDRVPPVSYTCARRSTIGYTAAVECAPKSNRGHLEKRQTEIAKCQGNLREPLLAAAGANGQEQKATPMHRETSPQVTTSASVGPKA